MEQLENSVKSATLPQAQKDEILDYLRPAKREAAKDSANKDLIGQNLKQVNETLKTVKETTETGKSLWNRVRPSYDTFSNQGNSCLAKLSWNPFKNHLVN